MAICNWCNQEMTAKVSCTCNTVEFPDGENLASIPFDCDVDNCHDCLTPNGGYHHPGCDSEKCPRCGGQLISCGCLDDGCDDEEQ